MKLPKYCKANQIRFKRKRLSKKKKQQADKQKVTKRHVGIVAKLAKRFARIETGEKPVYLPKAEAMAFAILETCCLNESHRLRLLDKNHLFVAGDSTKLKVDGNRYGKKVCHCYQKSCDCKRHYNAKEPTIGYDAHRDAFIYSHSLYQLNSCSTFHTAELPAYLMMTEGARHDSVTASFPMHRATQRLGIDAACFDAAHDATAFYQMAHDRWRTQVFIPLNTTNEGNYQQIPMEKISQQGIPICREGHDMYFSGYCKDRDRVKWRCPIKATKAGKSLGCECLCSSSTYRRGGGYTHPKDNLRLYPKTPRNSLTWKAYYNHLYLCRARFQTPKTGFQAHTVQDEI